MKLVFKVIAGAHIGGDMVCGGLVVDTVTHTHTFYAVGGKLNRPSERTYNHTPIDRVRSYKGLRLEHMHTFD